MTALASIVTPTMPGREDLLLDRCIPSVRAQTWPHVEHVIVSDRNPALAEKIVDYPDIRFVQINETWRDGHADHCPGALPWQIGSLLALGEYVGFVGDDDELLPDHIARHVAAMDEHDLHFTISPVRFVVSGSERFVVGDDTLAVGHVDSDGIMCRVEALRTATWQLGVDAPDALLPHDWASAGLRWMFIGGQPTAIHHDGWAAQ
ncbi:MAG TPA: glycosyltransferase [Jiangellaceae bacterium]|nr:glycosyltransferase [Jiangellaceae bacterium]